MTFKGLAYWHDAVVSGQLASDDHYESLIAHPRFAEACRLSARLSLARAEGEPKMNKLMKDGSSLFYAVFAFYLDARDGLTLSNIQKFCEDAGLASPGRSAAILIQLRLKGYVTPDHDQKDKRVRRYVPTPGMAAIMRRSFRDELAAVALIEPDAATVADRLDEPEIFRRYVLALGDGLEKAVRRDWNAAPLAAFADHTAGLLMLYTIALSSGDDDVYPPNTPVRISVADLARRLQVSRSHVFRLISRGEQHGFLRRNTEQTTILFEESLRKRIDLFHAGFFMGNASCAFQALQTANGLPAASVVAESA